jgi:hypothetical protein
MYSPKKESLGFPLPSIEKKLNAGKMIVSGLSFGR